MGADHLLAMVAVGVLAATQPRLGARIALPAAFVVGMAGGIALAALGAALPLAEPMILNSVLLLGVVLALAIRLPVLGGAALLGGFGLFHGTAHGLEMGSAAALPFGLAVLAATAMLHGAGAAMGAAVVATLRPQSALALRMFGVGVGLSGLAPALG
jgi:urease accessory protein